MKLIRLIILKIRSNPIVKKAFSRINLNKKNVIIIFVVISVTVLLVRLLMGSYSNYRDTIILQQQEHLLTIAKSISRSLELFVSEKERNLKMVAQNRRFQKAVYDYVKGNQVKLDTSDLEALYQDNRQEIDWICLLDSRGIVLYEHSNDDNNFKIGSSRVNEKDVAYVLKERVSYISEAYTNPNGHFSINILEPIFYGNEFQGMLIGSIKLDYLYTHLVEPVKAGKKGYAFVKNKDQIILMYPDESQIGMSVIKSRKDIYPNFDLSELEEVIKEQQKGKEGTAIYHSYWWPENKPIRVKKLSAYSPANIEKSFWIVTVAMSYDEIEGPIKENLSSVLEIAFGILLMFSIGIFIIVRMQKNKEALEMETKYLIELNKASEELRKREAELQHSQKLRIIGTLTGGIAHEFGNFLTPILGHSELMLDSVPEGSEMYEGVCEIFSASVKAKELIEQILVFSRNEKGIDKYKLLKINEFLKETLKFVKSIIPSTIMIEEDIDKDCGYIMANPTQIHQVIINLCTNAYHAMKEQGGTIKISIKIVNGKEELFIKNKSLQDKSYVKISIKDTGRGMDKETVDRIFDPFFTTKDVGEGTGLGLFMVHGIISNHKGEIDVESEVGRGSVFHVYLPLTKEHIRQEPLSDGSAPKGKEMILLVDDQPKVLNIMKKHLKKLGYSVVAKNNSVEALNAFSANPQKFDLIITDQTMPYLKGTEMADRIKEIRQDMKILIITGFVDSKVEEYVKKSIVSDYLVKPILSMELSEKIRKVLQG